MRIGVGSLTGLAAAVALLPGISCAEIYTETVAGFNAPMTVEVIIIEGRVDNLVVLKQAENSKDARKALETIARAVVRVGSDQVDVVTGATVTSKAVLLAVRTAQDEASGNSR